MKMNRKQACQAEGVMLDRLTCLRGTLSYIGLIVELFTALCLFLNLAQFLEFCHQQSLSAEPSCSRSHFCRVWMWTQRSAAGYASATSVR
eukprot:1141180-Amphidinium_carterae.1